jgi:hypothetical protein
VLPGFLVVPVLPGFLVVPVLPGFLVVPVLPGFLVVPVAPGVGEVVGLGVVVPVAPGVGEVVGLGVCAWATDEKLATGRASAMPKTRETAMDLASLLILTAHSSLNV